MTKETTEFPVLSEDAAASLSLSDVQETGRAAAFAASPDDVGDEEEENMETIGMQQVSLDDQEQAAAFEGASLPHPEDLPSGTTPSSPKRFCFRCLPVTTCLLVIGLIVFAVALAARPADYASGKSRPTHSEVMAFLVRHNVSSYDDLNDSTSFQYAASQYLAEMDDRDVRLPIPLFNDHYDTDVYMYTVRYVMVLLYMSWKGSHWRTRLNFLSPLDVCEWNAISLSHANGNGNALEVGGLSCDPVSGLPIKLDLEFNALVSSQIPTELGLLTTLHFLDLEFNGQAFQGTIPTEICHMHQLEHLGMRGNGLNGKIPHCMGRMRKLQHVLLGGNRLTGSIPTQLCALSNLQVLALHRNALTGTIPDCWGNDAAKNIHLESMILFDNALEGPIPSSLEHVTSLRELFLDQNGLWGDPVPTLNKLTQLELLFLDQNQLSGVLDHIFVRQADKLVALDLSGNRFTSEVFPTHLFKHPKLRVLDLSQNELKGSLPDTIPLNNVTQFFSIYNNQLTGQIPARIGNLQALQHLDLSYNFFNGTLPAALFQMTSLFHLFLSANSNLALGTMPTDLSTMTNLTELSLKYTNRRGMLPDISALTNLIYLDLDNNHFHGEIPEHYGTASNLQYLLLNRNPNINGTVPSFSSATSLVAAFFDGTRISGSLESICSLPLFTSTSEQVRVANSWVVVANCGPTNDALKCTCCHCCLPEETDSDAGVCSDLVVDTLDWTWEDGYARTARNIGFNISRVSLIKSSGGNSSS